MFLSQLAHQFRIKCDGAPKNERISWQMKLNMVVNPPHSILVWQCFS